MTSECYGSLIAQIELAKLAKSNLPLDAEEIGIAISELASMLSKSRTLLYEAGSLLSEVRTGEDFECDCHNKGSECEDFAKEIGKIGLSSL